MPHCTNHQSEAPDEHLVAGRVFAGAGCPKPLRVVLRALAIGVWTFFCYLAIRTVQLATIGRPELRKRRCYRVSLRWIHIMRALFGIRMFVEGKIPDSPFFLVINHHTWVGYFGIYSIFTARTVVLDKPASLLFTHILTQGMDPILTDRKRENVPVVNRELIAAIRRGENILIAPEGAVSPGHMIRRYHAALLEAAVVTGTPVHYCTAHWRTPEGCLPPSQSVIYGPDPHMRDASGRLAASELETWGPERPLLPHLIHTLALPHCDLIIRFGPEPLTAPDRFSLAQALHAASIAIFTPSA